MLAVLAVLLPLLLRLHSLPTQAPAIQDVSSGSPIAEEQRDFGGGWGGAEGRCGAVGTSADPTQLRSRWSKSLRHRELNRTMNSKNPTLSNHFDQKGRFVQETGRNIKEYKLNGQNNGTHFDFVFFMRINIDFPVLKPSAHGRWPRRTKQRPGQIWWWELHRMLNMKAFCSWHSHIQTYYNIFIRSSLKTCAF